MILIYTVHKDKHSAKLISKTLLEQKLVACVNYLPIESSFWWNNTLQSEQEIIALYKTTKKHWDSVQKTIEELHPYEVPCIIQIEAKTTKAYEAWINRETDQSYS